MPNKYQFIHAEIQCIYIDVVFGKIKFIYKIVA